MAIFKNRVVDKKCCEEDCPKAEDEDACKCKACCEPIDAEICIYEWTYEAVDNAKGCVTQYFRYATNVQYGKMTADGCFFTHNGEDDGDVVLEWKKEDDAEEGYWHYGDLIASSAGCEHYDAVYCNEDGREVAHVVGAKNVQKSKVMGEEWVSMDGIELQVGNGKEYKGSEVDRNDLNCDCEYTNCDDDDDDDGGGGGGCFYGDLDGDGSSECYCYGDEDGDGSYEYYEVDYDPYCYNGGSGSGGSGSGDDCQGCTDSKYDNYDSGATKDSGNCCYESEEQPNDSRDPCCFEKHRNTPEDEGVSFPSESEICCSHEQNRLGNC